MVPAASSANPIPSTDPQKDFTKAEDFAAPPWATEENAKKRVLYNATPAPHGAVQHEQQASSGMPVTLRDTSEASANQSQASGVDNTVPPEPTLVQEVVQEAVQEAQDATPEVVQEAQVVPPEVVHTQASTGASKKPPDSSDSEPQEWQAKVQSIRGGQARQERAVPSGQSPQTYP